jgi:CheY-like chemotaxis protein
VPLDFSRLHLLLIDDNDFMRDLYRQLLEAIGFRHEHINDATDGEQALAVLENLHIDIAICDLNMQPMKGKQFTRHVRMSERSPDPYLPIIVCTGHAELKHIVDARDAGATEILRKPVTAGSLYARLQAVIDQPRPFIFSQDFVGPDRRRRNVPFDGPDRRSEALDI